MMQHTLTKSVHVARLGVVNSHAGAMFVVENADGELDHFMTVDHFAWVDMGRPERITVTVEPGDLLNDEGEE